MAMRGANPYENPPRGHTQHDYRSPHAPQSYPGQINVHSNLTQRDNVRVQSGMRAQPREQDDTTPEPGRVGDVVRRFRVIEDGVVASRLQNEEISQHFEKNRYNRKTVREDIPVAKQVYTEEESRAQYERMRQLEEQKRIAERDAKLAQDLQKQLSTNQQPSFYQSNHAAQPDTTHRNYRQPDSIQPNYRQQPTHQISENRQPTRPSPSQPGQAVHAKYQRQSPDPVVDDYHVLENSQLRSINNHSVSTNSDRRPPDYNAALNAPPASGRGNVEPDSQFHDEYGSDVDEERLEAEDRELALRLQREEEERYERKKQQRALAKERRRLEQMIEQTNRIANPVSQENAAGDDFSDLYIPPDPNMTTGECRRLQEEQDAEIARLIQENESRGIRGGRDAALLARLKQIEQQDSQLARIIQDEENLRAKRRQLKQQQKLLQQQREVAERLAVNESGSGGLDPANRSHDQVVNQSQTSTRNTQENRQELSPHTDSLSIQTDIPTSDNNNAGRESRRVDMYAERSEHRSARPPTNASEQQAARPPDNLYAQHQRSGERKTPVAQGRGRHESFTDDSPTGPPPALPERRYKDDEQPENEEPHLQQSMQHNQHVTQHSQQHVTHHNQHATHHNHSHINHVTQQGDVRARLTRTHINETQHQPLESDHRPLARLKDMPPYRAQRPPPYKNPSQHTAQSREMNPQLNRHELTTPNSSHHHNEHSHNPPGHPPQTGRHANQPQHIHRHDLPEENSHYELPWNLEHQILGSRQGEQIVPKQVSPPAGRQTARHMQPGGEYIQTTESGHLVMNIAEAIDPTYDQREVVAQRRTSNTQHAGALDAGSEFTAIAGQRRNNGRSNRSGKRESCKQQ